MKWNKLVALGLAAVMAVSMMGCGASESESQQTTEDTQTGTSSAEETSTTETSEASESTAADYTLAKDGVLMVGTEIGYPPFESYEEDGKTPIGFDIDLMTAVAEKMGVEVEFVDTAWDGILAGLDTDRYDVVASAVTITEAREENYDFSTPYIQNYQSMVVLKDGDVTVTSPEEATGLTIGYQNETTSDVYVTDLVDNGLDVTTSEYDKILECYTDLEIGRIDAIMCDSTVASAYLNKEDSKFTQVWQQQENPEEFGIVVKQGNTLVEEINKYLQELEEDGTLEELTTKWFG